MLRDHAVDKLTDTLGIRVTAELHLVIKSLAEVEGQTAGEWVRSLIDAALQKEQARYDALNQIFGDGGKQANNNSAQQR
jgi:predicted DNA-binding protein